MKSIVVPAFGTSASPIAAFLIGPLADLWVIPSMTSGAGAASIGEWFGTGRIRVVSLIFIVVGITGLVVTLGAMGSRAYRRLSTHYAEIGEPTVEAVAG